jgi:hypothetical protein
MPNIIMSVIFLTFFCNYVTKCKLCFTSNSSLRETFFFIFYSMTHSISKTKMNLSPLQRSAIIKTPFHYAIKYTLQLPSFLHPLHIQQKSPHLLYKFWNYCSRISVVKDECALHCTMYCTALCTVLHCTALLLKYLSHYFCYNVLKNFFLLRS